MKSKDIKSFHHYKFMSMHEEWKYVLGEIKLSTEMAAQVNIMHDKLFINKDTTVDLLFWGNIFLEWNNFVKV